MEFPAGPGSVVPGPPSATARAVYHIGDESERQDHDEKRRDPEPVQVRSPPICVFHFGLLSGFYFSRRNQPPGGYTPCEGSPAAGRRSGTFSSRGTGEVYLFGY